MPPTSGRMRGTPSAPTSYSEEARSAGATSPLTIWTTRRSRLVCTKVRFRKVRRRPVPRRSLPAVQIRKSFTFEAAHVLPHHPGKCSTLHGHSYRLDVALEGPVQADGPAPGTLQDFDLVSRVA